MRDNVWLEVRLQQLWKKHFSDIQRLNPVTISFGRRAKTRLGSIKMNKNTLSPSIITITGYFRDSRIPEFLIDATIAHELCHYAHGFSSPHKQLQQYPHQGGIVDKEMIQRGLGDMLLMQKEWLKTNWNGITGPRKKRIRKLSILRFFRSN